MTKYCECGCGQLVKEGNRFVVGHNRRGVRQPIQERRKRARSQKQSWLDPTIREKRILGLKKAHENPECWRNLGTTSSKIMKKNWANPKIRRRILKALRSKKERQRRSEMSRKMWQDPSHRRRHSEEMKKRWRDPEYRRSTLKAMRKSISKKTRRKMSEAAKRWWRSPEHRRMGGEYTKKMWQNPRYRQRILSSLHSPETREKQLLTSRKSEVRKQISKSVKKLHRDPKYRRKFLEGRKKMVVTRSWYRDSPETIEKKRCSMKKVWAEGKIRSKMEKYWSDKEWRERRLAASLTALFKRPTKLEQRTIDIFQKHHLPFNYCGNGTMIIGGKCPDFYENNGRKLCIEVANKAEKLALRNKPSKEYERDRIEHFKKYGWRCLTIWEHELDDLEGVVEKIKTFTGAVV